MEKILPPLPEQPGVAGSRIAAICSLHGMGGIGKTELAREAARRMKPKNGIAEVNLRGWDSGQPMREEEALRELCPQIDSATDPTLPLPQLRAHWRAITAKGDLAVILDNLRDESLIEPLRPTAGITLITGRERIYRAGIQLVEVDVMEPDEAQALAIATDPGLSDQDAADLAQAVGYLPLAIALAAAYLARTGEPVSEMARRIGQAAAGKPTLQGLFERVVNFSTADLSEEQRARWLALSLPPGDFGLWTVEALWQDHDPRPELGELIHRHLVLPVEDGRWRLHDLLRQYGKSVLAGDPKREQALWRQLGPAAVVRLGEIDARFRSGGDAMVPALAELDAELPLFRAVNDWAAKNKDKDKEAEKIASVLPQHARIFTMRVDNEEYVVWLRTSFLAAKRRGISKEIGDAAGNLAFIYRRLKRYSRAIPLNKLSSKIHEEIGNQRGQVSCLAALGLIYLDLENMEEAKSNFEASLEKSNELDDPILIAQCLGNLGIVHKNLKNGEVSKDYYLRCIEGFEEIPNRPGIAVRGIAINRASLAELYEKFPNLGDPIDEYREAAKLAEELKMPEAETICKALAEAESLLAADPSTGSG